MSSASSDPAEPAARLAGATPHEHHITVSRTARYATLGAPGEDTRELWMVLHGHGQLAARFLRYFGTLDDGTRWLVAPEALSRYYLDPVGDRTHPERRVGATWMTREDRLSEISDHVGYLDALHAHLVRQLPDDGRGVPLRVVGFSQGVATATRWIAAGGTRPAHLVLWGGAIPADLDLAHEAGRRLAAGRLTLVVGDEDEFVDAAMVAAQRERLERHALAFDALHFDGGHRMDIATLRAVAALPLGTARTSAADAGGSP